MFFKKEVPIHLLPFIIRTAYYFCGDIFLEKVYEKLNNKNDSKFLDLFSNIIEDLLPDLRSGKEKPIIRIMGKDGVFRNIIDGENPDN